MEAACFAAGIPWLPFDFENVRDIAAWETRQKERLGNKSGKAAVMLLARLISLKLPFAAKLTQDWLETGVGFEGEAAADKGLDFLNILRDYVAASAPVDWLEAFDASLEAFGGGEQRVVVHVGRPETLDMALRRDFVRLARLRDRVTVVFSCEEGAEAHPEAEVPGAKVHEVYSCGTSFLALPDLKEAVTTALDGVVDLPDGFFKLLLEHSKGHAGALARKLGDLLDAKVLEWDSRMSGFRLARGLDDPELIPHFDLSVERKLEEFLNGNRENAVEIERFMTTAALCPDRLPVDGVLALCGDIDKDAVLDSLDEAFPEGFLFEDTGYGAKEFAEGQLVYRWTNPVAVHVLRRRLSPEEIRERASALVDVLMAKSAPTRAFRYLCLQLARLGDRASLAERMEFELDWLDRTEGLEALIEELLQEGTVEATDLIAGERWLPAQTPPRVRVAILRPIWRQGKMPITPGSSPGEFALRLTEALCRAGEYDETLSILAPAIKEARKSGDRWMEYLLRNLRASVFLLMGDHSYEAEQDAIWCVSQASRFGDSIVGAAKSLLGRVYAGKGSGDLAEPLLREAILILEHWGPLELLPVSIHALGRLYRISDRYVEAEPLLKRAVEIEEQFTFETHSSAATIYELGICYQDQGKYEEAETLLKRALAITEQLQGEVHPSTAASMHELGRLYLAQGKYYAAQPLLERAIVINERFHGKVHSSTAGAKHELARLYWEQGKFVEAEALLIHALDVFRQVHGEEHRETATTAHSLGQLRHHVDDLDSAELLLSWALRVFEQTWGSGSGRTRRGASDLRDVFKALGKTAEAQELTQRFSLDPPA